MAAVQRKIDWFLIGMVMAVALAALFPGPGARGGFLHPEIVTKAGVALIFFLHGVGISFASLKAGTLHWKLHLVVQSCTFLLFPILGLILVAPLKLSPGLEMGFFYLCALPSTVSSSVAMTAAARGNVAAALFNATLSSLLGVFLTPMWVGFKLKTSGQTLPLGAVLIDLAIWLVLPLLAGQVFRRWLAVWASRHKKLINVADRGTILVLVYTSFCDSMAWGVWSGKGINNVAYALIGSMVLFWVVFGIVGFTCDRLGFSWTDRIAAVFCGSKKTLASGVPMAQLMFGSNPSLSLILLPIIVYHPMQLIICGALASRWARRNQSSAEAR
jgi:sodium/bile acid cotransporter 7